MFIHSCSFGLIQKFSGSHCGYRLFSVTSAVPLRSQNNQLVQSVPINLDFVNEVCAAFCTRQGTCLMGKHKRVIMISAKACDLCCSVNTLIMQNCINKTKQNKTKLCSGCRPGLYFALLLTLDTDSKNKCFIFIHITSCIFSPTYSQTFFGNSTISHSIFKNPSYSRLHKYHKVQRGGNSFFQEFLLFCKHVYIFTISQLKISGL